MILVIIPAYIYVYYTKVCLCVYVCMYATWRLMGLIITRVIISLIGLVKATGIASRVLGPATQHPSSALNSYQY